MKIVSINLGNFGSTGFIMKSVSEMARKAGYEVMTAYPQNNKNLQKGEHDILICSNLARRINERIAYLTGFRGMQGWISTKVFLHKLERFSPDILHLHNLHNSYINLELLFGFIKKHNIQTVWTLHDCWAFTGQCPHFTMVKCDKWKTGCYDCPQYRQYPASYVDRTKTMWKLKKKWFTGVQNMTIVTPSKWLADLVKESFLAEYPIKVIHNGIDLSVFKPTENDFRAKYDLQNKNIVLGVAFGWGFKKGLDVFTELSERLDENKYQIVLVGTDDTVDKQLPKNIISIHRTQNQKELAEIYTAADLFVNPTREENYPTVNMEAIACGTPVLTFDTGGSPEIIDETSGCVVECDNVDALEHEIIRICETNPYSKDACLAKAREFDKNEKFREYIELYEVLNGEKQSS